MSSEEIASVAMIPETESRDSPGENGLKRRNSEILEQEQKRHKTNSGKNSPTAKKEEEEIGTREKIDLDQRATGAHSDKAAADTRASRKKTGVTDEKQRSKRLFGAFLGNLNRPSDQVSKRRAEIEQRRKAELQKQDDERLEDRQKRLENLTVQRQKGQIQVDEQNMHIRHRNMLETANFLQTKSEPKLYYRPWELTSDEEDKIDEQLRDAQAQIDRELVEFEEQKQNRINRDEGHEEIEATKSNAHEGETQAGENPEVSKEPVDESKESGDNGNEHNLTDTTTNHDHIPTSQEAPDADPGAQTATRDTNELPQNVASKGLENNDDLEDDGDHIEEGDEDTVIY